MGILNDEVNRIHHEMAKIADKYFGADRLISADALLREAMEDGAYGYVDAEQIANAPTVDAEPVRHGRWIKKDSWYYCSECGTEMFFTGTYDESQHYCYNCGAKMNEVEDE